MEVTTPWTETTRRQYRREGLRYASDMRQRVTDTAGDLVGLAVHAADIQDRDGVLSVIASICVSQCSATFCGSSSRQKARDRGA